jgi:hypothetical protein
MKRRKKRLLPLLVIPAKAGIHLDLDLNVQKQQQNGSQLSLG